MQYSLAYGREQLAIELPEQNVVKVLKIQSSAALEDPMEAVWDVLEVPIEAEPLAAIAEGKKSACVVICDTTRPVPNSVVLPPILQTLEDSGIDLPKITILIATGLRRNSSSEERTELIGEAIALRKFKVSDHSARKLHQHEYLGVTKASTPIWVDRRYLEAEVKVLTGVIEPNSIVGFNGGRESICPGIAASETVTACFSSEQLAHENVCPGSVEDNPVHPEQMEIARKAGCDFVVNVILNQDRKISKVVGGHMNYAFLEGASIARKRQTDTLEKQVDIVVTSGGGFPYDKTWYQTIQGIIGALDILKPGGTIIIASACDEGVGGDEFEKSEEQFASIDELMTAITQEDQSIVEQRQLYELQLALHELTKALRKGKVKVVSKGVTPELLQKFFVTPCASVEEAVAEALEEYGSEATIAVIPSGPCVLAIAKQKEPVPPQVEKSAVKPVEKPVEEPAVEESETIEEPEPTKKSAKKATAKKAVAKKAAVKKTVEKKVVEKKTVEKKTETKKAVKKATKK